MAKRFRFTINGQVYHASMEENPLTEKIATMCPFGKDYSRRGEHEYYTSLPGAANAKGCTACTEGYKNRIYYFEGWNALSLLFDDCRIAPYEIHYLGDFEEDVADVLRNADGNIHVLCEVE